MSRNIHDRQAESTAYSMFDQSETYSQVACSPNMSSDAIVQVGHAQRESSRNDTALSSKSSSASCNKNSMCQSDKNNDARNTSTSEVISGSKRSPVDKARTPAESSSGTSDVLSNESASSYDESENDKNILQEEYERILYAIRHDVIESGEFQ